MLVAFCIGVLVPVAVNSYNNSQEQPEWLMVMEAERGEFQETTDGGYTLTLTGVKPDVLAFTDRPERQAQRWDTTKFLNEWANNVGELETDPPNAVISAGGEAAITINDPQVSGDTVTFTATPLPGQTLPTDTINQPTLFIDDLMDFFKGNPPQIDPNGYVDPRYGPDNPYVDSICLSGLIAPADGDCGVEL